MNKKILRRTAFISFVIALFSVFSSCSIKADPLSFICMDTVCTVNAFDQGSKKLYGQIKNYLLDLESKYSVTKEQSQISIINGSDESVAPEQDVFNVLSYVLGIAEITDGDFSPALGKLIDLWNITGDSPSVPSEEKIRDTLSDCDYRNIKLDPDTKTVTLCNLGSAINLGAAIKGYACNGIVEILRSYGIKKAVVDLGGNVYVYGKKETGEPWTVGIKNPAAPEEGPLLILHEWETSVVTSGIYERNFSQNGKTYHHILDPKTGWPVENSLASVTIVSPDSFLCDCLSTSLFVMGKEKAIKMIPRLRNELGEDFGVVFVEKNGTVTATSSLKGKINFSKNQLQKQTRKIYFF